MLEKIMALTWQDVLLAACIAYVIFRSVGVIQKAVNGRKAVDSLDGKNMNMAEVYEKCRTLFPISSISFGGREFTRGMRIKIVTMQHSVIEGEFIGLNRLNLICIKTNTQIIAHQLEKIKEISKLE